MALTAVETTIMGLLDRAAFQVSAGRYVAVGGTDAWTRVDAAGDETFENRVKGSIATAYDAAMESQPIGQMTYPRQFWQLIDQYAHTDLSLAGLDAYLASKLWRADAKAATILSDAGIVLSAANIHGDADAGAAAPGVSLGNLTQSGSIASAADISTSYGPSMICGRVTVKGATDWTLSVTCKRTTGANVAVAQVVAGTGIGGAVGDVYILGRQALIGGAAAGQKVIPVAATAQFLAANYVLISQWSGAAPDEVWLEQEVGLVASLVTDTSVTVTTNLLHTYTTDAFVTPLFRGVVAASGSGGNASDRIYFYPCADRRLEL